MTPGRRIGGGLEYAFFSRWSAKIEYLHISKQIISYTLLRFARPLDAQSKTRTWI